jgi:multidrug transporter EmrE-like cation transporter
LKNGNLGTISDNISNAFRVLGLPFSLILISAFFDSYVSYVIKYTFNEKGRIDSSSFLAIVSYVADMLLSPLLLTGIIGLILAPIFWLMALKKTELSVAYPLSVACHLVFIFGFGLFFLEEAISLQKVLSCSLLMTGVFYLYRP